MKLASKQVAACSQNRREAHQDKGTGCGCEGLFSESISPISMTFASLRILVSSAFLFFLMSCSSGSRKESEIPLRSQASPTRNALLITVDTLRADRLECYGYGKVKTPVMNRLAEEGVMFQQAVAQVPLTLPSHCSILTGLSPRSTGVRDQAGFSLANEKTTLAELFKSSGYETAAFVGASVLNAAGGLGQGFDVYSDLTSVTGKTTEGETERRGDAVITEALQWMLASGRKPFFVWIHLFDPHTPYSPPEPYKSQYAASPYDGEIAYVDSLLGSLFSTLSERRLEQTTTVLFTSDHGEGLGEHGEQAHGYFLYDATLRVPLIIKDPSSQLRNRVVRDQVRSIDIAPTLIELFRLSKPDQMEGQSLVSLAHGEREPSPRIAFSETYFPFYHFEWSPLHSIRTLSFKYIEAPKPELFDLAHDPAESENVLKSQAEVASSLAEQLKRDSSKSLANPTQALGAISAASGAQLRSLGYVGAARSPGKSKPTDFSKLPDPKDKIALYNLLEEALHDAEEGRTGQSNRKLLQILRQDPRIVDAHLNLGVNRAQKGENAKAIQSFKQVLKLDDRNVVATYNLALCYAKLKMWEEAAEGFKATLLLSPEDPQPQLDLGRVYLLQGDFDAAARTLKSLLARNPASSEGHYLLSQVYQAKGMKAEAENELLSAQRLGGR
jgi:arylsulfatase A-like enzyme